MNPLANPKIIRHIMQANGLQFSKRYGQNFLTDEGVLQEIVSSAGITPDDGVLEIGPGIGTLTWELASHAGRVAAVEIDSGLVRILPETLADFSNVTVIHGDILKQDLPALIRDRFDGKAPFVVANLPYYITTPILMALLESELPFPKIVVMIQKEVAERIAASPGGKDYGVLSVSVNFYAEPELLVTVPAASFLPAPNVDSVVLALTPRPHPTCKPKDRAAFFKVVRAAFAQRRKTLLNSLCGSGVFRCDKAQIEDGLLACGIDPKLRGETLSMEQFCKLSDHYCKNSLI